MENSELLKSIRSLGHLLDWESASVIVDGYTITQQSYHFDNIVWCIENNKTAPMFRKGQYYFWRDIEGYWGVSIGPEDWYDLDEDNPPNCAYKFPGSIACLKGIKL
jgi:hypothetical protein